MAQDIVAAVVAYLQGSMGQSLASSSGYAQVYADYAPLANPDGSTVSMPYAEVTDAAVETYSAQSENYVSTGYYLSEIAVGTLTVALFATTKSQARLLGIDAVRKLSDSVEQLTAADGRVITMLPLNVVTRLMTGVGLDGSATAYVRIVIMQYAQQFLE